MLICRHDHRLPSFTHSHAMYEIIYCIGGMYHFHYEMPDGTVISEIVRRPKSMIFIPPNIPHGVTVLQYPYDRYFILFSHAMAQRILGDTLIDTVFKDGGEDEEGKAAVPRFLDVASDFEQIEALFKQMYDAQCAEDMDEEWRRVNTSSLCGLLLCEIYRHYRSFFTRSLAQYTKPVQAAKTYIDEHYDLPVTVQSLAREVYLSPNYLSKSFASQIGMSPRQYLTQIRLTMAQKMLCSSQMPIQEIAMRVGFGDANYFIQCFKQCYKKTPKQYRKEMERTSD